ncbi:peptidoglycan-associated lipoprotein Pal [Bartonella quintana]|uniref:Peptidoglycan-associated lipoprotein n=3 Tax=Bartonella quintana TaxID=803 RepID=A0A0H3LWM3_BARQU|nr:peptidoglycan-associated lipoprotein Pal [Bartonella quintana]ETS12880.1 peptidoglycan-associated lipoprotein [Bartonella quintana BQ2-D70]ETS14698.1 peptidoglycan-associated lipoprotein [Bartonella quintana JK 73rel]ETS17131.1 peptidoglycan-associated lipoprotein [Bartonella quintana JK 73]ETS17226.1 peptidoglycan-associated lipoprotein [Bartonella quintana JK 12]ETS19424.1 peptidoglycan-associated lipoprotein [Bartonella quintana JK 7]
MRSLKNISLQPLALVLFFSLSLVGCGRKYVGADGMNGSSLKSAGFNQALLASGQDFTVNVGDRVFFSLDSSSIEPDAEAVLIRQAQWLLRHPSYSIVIEGHADERGTREYNLALGQRRAVAVRNYLISLGVSSQRMQTISYGKERPVAVCDDISCWNQNRRAVTKINNMNGG